MKYQVSTCPAPLTIRNRDIIDATGTAGLQDRFISLSYMYILREKRPSVHVGFMKWSILIASCTCRLYEMLDPDSLLYL